MAENVVILVAEDDLGHFRLMKKNLWLVCVDSEIRQFKDGAQILDFLDLGQKSSFVNWKR